MEVRESVTLVTGANRGLGHAFVQALLAAGAKKVYVGARTLMEVADPRLQPLKLDITDPHDISNTSHRCHDVTILINNAGIMRSSPLLASPSMDNAQAEMETNYFGTLAMCRAFAPILGSNGGGALVNMLSVVSWYTNPFNGSYGASKAAEWALTNGVRIELRKQGTLVIGVYAGFINTDMASHIDDPEKSRPEDVASETVKAIATGREEVLADESSRRIRVMVDTNPQALYQELQQEWERGGRWVSSLGSQD